MIGLRRSGRIAKEIPILLVGTDLKGKVFSEETKTVLLSRHGAGIVSRHKISPDGFLTLRLAGSSKEAEIRLVGPMGTRGDGCVFGVAFRDPELDFWEIEFPPPAAVDDQGQLQGLTLECTLCHGREFVQQSDVETDVYAVNESILRYCGNCGLTTNWTRARAAESTHSTSPTARPPGMVKRDSLNRQLFDEEAVTQIALELLEPEPALEPVLPGQPAEKQNRRRDVRTRVNFTACIRHPFAGEEIVECDNISRGGFSFRSQKQYPKDSMVQVALPYFLGSASIFVFAEIKHVEDVLGGTLFRYGAAYLKTPTVSRHY
jgi:PilZ domain-containing protein